MFSELLALVIGQNAVESLRTSKDSRALVPDTLTDSLSGVASSVLGTIGVAIGVFATMGGLRADSSSSFVALAIIAGIGLGCSYFGSYFGRRAPYVTRRFLGMAKYAVLVSPAGMVLPVVAVVIAAARVFL